MGVLGLPMTVSEDCEARVGIIVPSSVIERNIIEAEPIT